jgi:hypothetical protein
MGQAKSRLYSRDCLGFISVVFKQNQVLQIIPILRVHRPTGIGNTLTVERLEDFTDDTTILSKTKEQILERVMRFLCSGEDIVEYNKAYFVDGKKTTLVKNICVAPKEAALIGLWHPDQGVAAYLENREEGKRPQKNGLSHSTWLFESNELIGLHEEAEHDALSRLMTDFDMDEKATAQWIDMFLYEEPSRYEPRIITTVRFPFQSNESKNNLLRAKGLPLLPPSTPKQNLSDLPPGPTGPLISPFVHHPAPDASRYPPPPPDRTEPPQLPRPPRLMDMYGPVPPPPPGMHTPPSSLILGYPSPSGMHSTSSSYPLIPPPGNAQTMMGMPMLPPTPARMQRLAELIQKYTNLIDRWGPRLQHTSGEQSDAAVEAIFSEPWVMGFPMLDMDGDALSVSHIIWDSYLRPADGELALSFFEMLEYMQTHEVAVYDRIKDMKEQHSRQFATCTTPSACCSVFFCFAPANPHYQFNNFMYCNQAVLLRHQRQTA